jgi:hypothetical protein
MHGGSVRRPAAATNLYEVGPLPLRAANACLDAGATPVLVHHADEAAPKKADGGGPLDLEDPAYAAWVPPALGYASAAFTGPGQPAPERWRRPDRE